MKHIFFLFFFLLAMPALSADVWIDVRSPAEYKEGHIKNAVNIPHKQIADEIDKLGLDKDTRIRLYCGSGGRAGIAKKTLNELGYTKVINAGGYKDIAVK